MCIDVRGVYAFCINFAGQLISSTNYINIFIDVLYSVCSNAIQRHDG